MRLHSYFVSATNPTLPRSSRVRRIGVVKKMEPPPRLDWKEVRDQVMEGMPEADMSWLDSWEMEDKRDMRDPEEVYAYESR